MEIRAESKEFLRMTWFFFKTGFTHGLFHEFGTHFRWRAFLKKDLYFTERLKFFFLKFINYIL